VACECVLNCSHVVECGGSTWLFSGLICLKVESSVWYSHKLKTSNMLCFLNRLFVCVKYLCVCVCVCVQCHGTGELHTTIAAIPIPCES